MKKKLFLYFLSIFLICQLGFYLSDGLAREQEQHGFQACWSGSRIPGRPTWRQECNDLTVKELMHQYFDRIRHYVQ